MLVHLCASDNGQVDNTRGAGKRSTDGQGNMCMSGDAVQHSPAVNISLCQQCGGRESAMFPTYRT